MRCTTKMHAYEGFCEDLARQNTVAHLFQLQLGFRRCRVWVSVLSHMGFSLRRSVLKATILGHCTVCLGIKAHRPCLDLSVYLQSVYLSPVCPLFCRSDWLANPIACASFPRLALPPL